jgi:hypothetical protein
LTHFSASCLSTYSVGRAGGLSERHHFVSQKAAIFGILYFLIPFFANGLSATLTPKALKLLFSPLVAPPTQPPFVDSFLSKRPPIHIE